MIENTNDVQEFALSDDNYDPKTIAKVLSDDGYPKGISDAAEMLGCPHSEAAGLTLHYGLERSDEPKPGKRFEVHAWDARLTISFVREEGRDIWLETTLDWPGAKKHGDLLAMATDLVEHAAIALVRERREQVKQWKKETRATFRKLRRKGRNPASQ